MITKEENKEKNRINPNIPRLRFKEFSGEWEVRTIGNLIAEDFLLGHLDGNHGALYPKSEEFKTEGVPYIGAHDFIDGRVSLLHCKYLSKERAKLFKKGLAINGDVLFAHNATVGPVALLETKLDYLILSTTATYFRCNQRKLNNIFLLQLFQLEIFVNQYRPIMAQSTRNQIPITTQRKLKISLPSLSEQTKIAEFLGTVDERIVSLKTKKTLLEEYKKGIMARIFSQKIRFLDENGNNYPAWEEKKLGEVGEVITGKTPLTNDLDLWNGSIQFITPTDININNKYQENSQ